MTDKISALSFLGADLNRDWRVRKVSKSLSKFQIYLFNTQNANHAGIVCNLTFFRNLDLLQEY